jgi:hypothetical protein
MKKKEKLNSSSLPHNTKQWHQLHTEQETKTEEVD